MRLGRARTPRGAGLQTVRLVSSEGFFDPPAHFFVACLGFGSPSPLSRYRMTAREAFVKQRRRSVDRVSHAAPSINGSISVPGGPHYIELLAPAPLTWSSKTALAGSLNTAILLTREAR
jgi:hypothetical protein